jgi:cytochrome b pre-mRNA-processing protein 3
MSLRARIQSLFAPPPGKLAARRLFRGIMAQARAPELYLEGGVADTVDGRFDLAVLHLYFMLRRLKEAGAPGRAMSQLVFDAAFSNFDEALREMGVGDLSVGKKIRKMAEAFYGRLDAYERALTEGTQGAFEAALVRNMYRGVPPGPAKLESLGHAIDLFRRRLDAAPLDALLNGNWEARGAPLKDRHDG